MPHAPRLLPPFFSAGAMCGTSARRDGRPLPAPRSPGVTTHPAIPSPYRVRVPLVHLCIPLVSIVPGAFGQLHLAQAQKQSHLDRQRYFFENVVDVVVESVVYQRWCGIPPAHASGEKSLRKSTARRPSPLELQPHPRQWRISFCHSPAIPIRGLCWFPVPKAVIGQAEFPGYLQLRGSASPYRHQRLRPRPSAGAW